MEERIIDLKEHQSILLRLLSQLDIFCRENGLSYFITRGTLLGAVRHKGFIPWDDDADVVMPRKDYEKLLKSCFIAKDAQVISIENSQGHYHPYPHCNIVDTGTIMVEKSIKRSTEKGVFLDIFPLDGLPDGKFCQKLHLFKIMFLQSLLSNAIYNPPGGVE